MADLIAFDAEQGHYNRVTIPTKAQVDAVFDEFADLMAETERTAEEKYRIADELCRGLHWAVCSRLRAKFECDTIIDTGHYRMAEVLRCIHKAHTLLIAQWKYMRALAELEKRNTQKDAE